MSRIANAPAAALVSLGLLLALIVVAVPVVAAANKDADFLERVEHGFADSTASRSTTPRSARDHWW